ncbi:AAA family ATPase [Coleofasciculus sp.]|uniref:AAA family ATPase n=1 Tax=Coleofasciculus sp. TaxID=3100458 RepID=UPI0039FAA79E
MKISKIIVKGFQQFNNFQLDLVNPKTGKPLDKICLIGTNGTGKTTILEKIIHLLNESNGYGNQPKQLKNLPLFAVKFSASSGDFFACHPPYSGSDSYGAPIVYYNADVEQTDEWHRFVTDPTQKVVPPDFCIQHYISSQPVPSLTNKKDLIIHVPADRSLLLQKGDLPVTTLDEALKLFQNFPVYHFISMENAGEFWKLLIYLVKKRESDYLDHLKQPKNRKKTIEEVEAEFKENHPEILQEIGNLWNRILDKPGLKFDIEEAGIPVQLNENLQAYVKVKSSGQPLPYNSLSSGIRNYIFKLGHIKTLYFQRQIERGFLLVDEPENSLYPDLLYDLIEQYLSIIQNTQFFVATHNPIIAAQFEPYERIHLDFDDQGFVTATSGVTPIGDDPNDLLIKDFHVRSIYGKQGLQKWERFLELQRLIHSTSDINRQQELITEYLEIGNAYNFDPSK